MEKLNGTHIFEKMPSALRTAEEISEKVNIDKGRLIELADASVCPHYRLDGGQPLFNQAEIKNWMAWNLLQRFEGKTSETLTINLVAPIDRLINDPPKEIKDIQGLKQVPNNYEPVVYFLCQGDEVVYVGQSISVFQRMKQHRADDKIFDNVFALPCPRSELDVTERKFIKILNPILNKQCYN